MQQRSQTEEDPWNRAGELSDGGSYPGAANGNGGDADREDDLRWGYRSERYRHARGYSDEPEDAGQPGDSCQDGFRAASYQPEHAHAHHAQEVDISE